MHNVLDYLPLTHWLLLGPLLIAAYTDLRYGMIYNWLTLPAMLVGVGLHTWLAGWVGLTGASGAALLGLMVLYPGFMVGGMAAGDLKLMAAIGAFLGWPSIFGAIGYSMLAGGLLALLHAARHRVLARTLRRLWGMTTSWVVPGMKADLDFQRSEAPPYLYGIAIVLGTIAWMARSWPFPHLW